MLLFGFIMLKYIYSIPIFGISQHKSIFFTPRDKKGFVMNSDKRMNNTFIPSKGSNFFACLHTFL